MTPRDYEQIEYDLADRVELAIKDYERWCRREMRRESMKRWGHDKCYILEYAPTVAGRFAVVKAVLDRDRLEFELDDALAPPPE